ncbi:MAG: hypothetical protein KBG04_08690 [Bacteroidales bacterium]|nr:hypothetical protein [Bacteroidales bacterium]
MDEKIKELTLLLLYLTSWKEKNGSEECLRSWKGYPFEILDELIEDEYIKGSKTAKSVYLSEEGVKLAKELERKYLFH